MLFFNLVCVLVLNAASIGKPLFVPYCHPCTTPRADRALAAGAVASPLRVLGHRYEIGGAVHRGDHRADVGRAAARFLAGAPPRVVGARLEGRVAAPCRALRDRVERAYG